MEKQTKQRLKCNVTERTRVEEPGRSKRVSYVLLELAKAGVRGLMMNPIVLKWLLVHVPSAAGKLEELLKGALAFFNPFE